MTGLVLGLAGGFIYAIVVYILFRIFKGDCNEYD